MSEDGTLRLISIDRLGLPSRSLEFLRKYSVLTIGDVIDRVKIVGFAKNEIEVRGELHRAVRSMLTVAQIDWDEYHLNYAAGSSFPILPRRLRATWSPRQVVEDLPAAAVDMVRLQFTPIHSYVLQQRILKDEPAQSLAQIGLRYGVTPARIHTMEKRVLRLLRTSLLESDYRRCHFRFHPAFAAPVQQLAGALRHKGVGQRNNWHDFVQDIWTLNIEAFPASQSILAKLLNAKPSYPRK